MKRIIPATIIGLLITLAIVAFQLPEKNSVTSSPQDQTAMFPEHVSTILQTSCFDCHSDESGNFKAKSKLNLSKWNDLSNAKKVGKMENIAEVVKKGDMPPKKYLEKNPAATLSTEQVDAVTKWTTEETNKLMGGGE